MSPSHGHTGDHINLILQGEIHCGDLIAKAGSHIMLEWGDVFGPWEAGPEGCELYGFVAGDGAPFAGDTEAYHKLLAERAAEVVPLPMPKHLPPWADVSSAQGAVTNWTAEPEA
jgi:hypothetical protein